MPSFILDEVDGYIGGRGPKTVRDLNWSKIPSTPRDVGDISSPGSTSVREVGRSGRAKPGGVEVPVIRLRPLGENTRDRKPCDVPSVAVDRKLYSSAIAKSIRRLFLLVGRRVVERRLWPSSRVRQITRACEGIRRALLHEEARTNTITTCIGIPTNPFALPHQELGGAIVGSLGVIRSLSLSSEVAIPRKI